VFAVGIDLAWSPRNGSGLALAEDVGGRWRLRDIRDALGDNQEILSYVETRVGTHPAILAIDAPLVVPYPRSGRDGDRLVTQVFGPSQAGVYPATRVHMTRYGGQRIWDLVRGLEALGFRHDWCIPSNPDIRRFFETYPHAAAVALFNLDRTLKYKARQGRTYETRWDAFRTFEARLRDLRSFDPPLEGVEEFLDPDVTQKRGRALKAYEDRLDAILCAYVAAYHRTWGTRRCAVFGSLEGGYIVTPMNRRLASRIAPGTPGVVYQPTD